MTDTTADQSLEAPAWIWRIAGMGVELVFIAVMSVIMGAAILALDSALGGTLGYEFSSTFWAHILWFAGCFVVDTLILWRAQRAATIGMRVTGQRIVTKDSNTRPPADKLLLRNAIKWLLLCTIIGSLVFLTMLNNPDKRGLHESLSATRTVST